MTNVQLFTNFLWCIRYEKLRICPHSCARGYPLCISVPTPYHTIVRVATAQGKQGI